MTSKLDLPDGVEINHITVCSYTNDFSEEGMLSQFTELESIEPSDEFTTQVRDINDENVEESSIYFSNKPPSEQSNPESDLLFFNVEENKSDRESSIHIHSEFSWDLYDSIISMFKSILETVDKLEVEKFNVHFTVETKFSELNLPIESTSEEDVIGIRLHIEDGDYIIQEGDEDTIIYFDLDEPYTIDSEEFLVSRIEQVLNEAESLIP